MFDFVASGNTLWEDLLKFSGIVLLNLLPFLQKLNVLKYNVYLMLWNLCSIH